MSFNYRAALLVLLIQTACSLEHQPKLEDGFDSPLYFECSVDTFELEQLLEDRIEVPRESQNISLLLENETVRARATAKLPAGESITLNLRIKETGHFGHAVVDHMQEGGTPSAYINVGRMTAEGDIGYSFFCHFVRY